MKRLLPAPLAVVLFLAPCFAPASRAQDAPARPPLSRQDIDDSLGTEWYGVYMLGKKVGYAKGVIARLDDPRRAGYAVAMEGRMTVVAVGAKQEMKFAQVMEFDPTPPYRLRQASMTLDARNSVQRTTVYRTDKGFEATRSTDGDMKKIPVGSIDLTFGDLLAPLVWVRRGPRAGDRLTCRTFYLDDLKADLERRQMASVKMSHPEGVPVTYFEANMTSAKFKVPVLERYNQKGRLLSGKMADVIELRSEPEEQAKNVSHSADLFVLGSIKVDRPLGDPTKLGSLVLKVTGKEAEVLKDGPRQTVERVDANTFICKTGAPYAHAVPATAKEVEECLKETDGYPIHHPRVEALAKEAVGDAATPREKVDRLVRFVARYLTPDYTTRPRSVPQLLAVRKGACTEFALLFTTLARAAGVPAREVIGLVYLGDDQRAFGPHAWNEVVIDGRWVPVDTAWKETEVNPTHISFGAGRPDDVNWLTSFLGTFGKLSFRVVEAKGKP